MPGTRLSISQFTVALFAAAMAGLVLITALPHDRYIRFQNLTDPAVVKAGWIYERIHFDPAPIDVVFIGTSHTVFGVDSGRAERACRAAGGKYCASVNFALQHLGRDTHWLLAREVLEARNPKLLVIEVTETEPRALHPAFGSLANTKDILSAPLVINTSFFGNLVRLPFRQFSLFARNFDPRLFGLHLFDQSRYRTHWDDTYAEVGSFDHPIMPIVPRTKSSTAAELEDERAHPQAGEGAGPALPGPLKPLEHRANLIYLNKIVALAREKRVAIRFVYMPRFRAQAAPDFETVYRAAGPIYDMPAAINEDSELWLDVGHLNFTGAGQFSDWLGAKIAGEQAVK